MPAVFSATGEQAASKPSTLGNVLGFLGPTVMTAGITAADIMNANKKQKEMKNWVAQNSVPMTNAQMAADTQAFSGPEVPGLGQAFQLGNAFAGQPGSQLISSPQPFAPQLGVSSMLNRFSPWPNL